MINKLIYIIEHVQMTRKCSPTFEVYDCFCVVQLFGSGTFVVFTFTIVL